MSDLANQPAFPESKKFLLPGSSVYQQVTSGGMTVRQYLAGLAMQGLLMSNRMSVPELRAKVAVEQADALIAELEKSK